MKITFKQYLITEKVHASTYREILNDTKFFLGLEYEYYDHNLAGFGNGDDDYEDVYEHKDYRSYNEEATEIYEKFVDEIVKLQTSKFSLAFLIFGSLIKTPLNKVLFI